MKKCFLFLSLIINQQLMSQSIVQGEYYFRKMEMVAGFKFSADGKFEFFYAYGVVDRSATGTFSLTGDTLKLRSDKEPGKDFNVIQQSKNGNGYTIQFTDPNKYLVDNIHCIFVSGTEEQGKYTGPDGKITIDLPHCDKIYVEHLLFPDIVTLIKDEKNENNNFTLTLNPSLGQVSFKGIDFKIEDENTISCIPNYLMEMEGIQFTKQGQE